MRVAVVNCSAPHYNLGAAKLAGWLRDRGDEVTEFAGDPGMFAVGFDLVCVSAIFSWHMPIARDVALRVRDHAEVWAGGPAFFANGAWFQAQTGIEPHFAIRYDDQGREKKVYGVVDGRFDQQRGTYKMAFATRGCDVGCSFCIVWQMEGRAYTRYPDFQPAPMLCDSNLSAIPVAWQEHIIRRYQETGVPLLDANSGFEPKTFDEDTYRRWKPIIRGAWRFAFDELSEASEVRRMAGILASERARRKRVYVLLGNEPIEACIARARKVIEWGCEPYCQVMIPLNWRADPKLAPPRFDWPSGELLRDVKRYFNSPQVWRSTPLHEYVAPRTYNRRPFAFLAPMITVA